MSEDINPELIEKAAKAEWEYEWPDRSWDKTLPDLQEFYLGASHAALAAILPDVIRQAKAEAWDEGLSAGADLGISIGKRMVGTRSDWPTIPKNPYRTERTLSGLSKQRAVVYVVAHRNGDDMCGGFNLHGIYTSEEAAQARLNEVVSEDFLGVSVYPIPLNVSGWLGYKMDRFESSGANEEDDR